MFPTLTDKAYLALGIFFTGVILFETGWIATEVMFAMHILQHNPNIHIW